MKSCLRSRCCCCRVGRSGVMFPQLMCMLKIAAESLSGNIPSML